MLTKLTTLIEKSRKTDLVSEETNQIFFLNKQIRERLIGGVGDEGCSGGGNLSCNPTCSNTGCTNDQCGAYNSNNNSCTNQGCDCRDMNNTSCSNNGCTN
jgi:hypothetical protein